MVRWTIFTLRAGWIAFSANSEAILCLVSDSRSLDSWQCALTYIRSAGKNDSRQFVIIGGHRGNVSVHLFFPAFQQGCKIDYGITENEGGIDNFFLSLISKQNFSRGKNLFRVRVSCSIPRFRFATVKFWKSEREREGRGGIGMANSNAFEVRKRENQRNRSRYVDSIYTSLAIHERAWTVFNVWNHFENNVKSVKLFYITSK